jgi:hypothetical protein
MLHFFLFIQDLVWDRCNNAFDTGHHLINVTGIKKKTLIMVSAKWDR